MAPGKKTVQAPIDKPLQKAYLREFTGWSTAYPPGNSEPTSCRLMENVMIKRNGSIAVRPGLRYVSYKQTPDMDSLEDAVQGLAHDEPFIGSLEPFYLLDGTKALLTAVIDKDTHDVGFRAVVFTNPDKMVFKLTDPEIGFYIPQGEASLHFTANTKHVTYLQIDNKIFAMSDAGESIRMFIVGTQKVAKRLNGITVPEWSDEHKLSVFHPNWQWIRKLAYTVRRNELLNPSFEAGTDHWSKGSTTRWAINRENAVVADRVALEVWTIPLRTNLATSPLHNVSSTGISGWHSGKGDPELSGDGDWLKVFDAKGRDVCLARSTKLTGVEAGRKYHLAFNFDLSNDALARARLQFYRNNGSEIGDPVKFFITERGGRFTSPAIEAPAGTVAARIFLGADSTEKTASWSKFKNVMLCRGNEDPAFFSGASGAGFYWEGVPNESASQYWPDQDITIVASRVNVVPGGPVAGSLHVRSITGQDKPVDLDVFIYDLNRTQVGHTRTSVSTGTGAWVRPGAVSPVNANTVAAGMQITIYGVGRHQRFALDAGMLESNKSTIDTYFDGSTVGDAQLAYTWENPQAPHLCASIRTRTIDLTAIPAPEVPKSNTLVADGGVAVNKYKMGFFYTFENEIGESAPSKITELRIKRPQSNWMWLAPGDGSPEPEGEPDENNPTSVADLCADQLAVVIPEDVYNNAVAAGALRWNLYTFAWSDQESVPVEATWAGSRDLFADDVARLANTPLTYLKGGWINITPARKFSTVTELLPTAGNRVDYSNPPKARNGLVAGDRIILVGDNDAPGAIKWTSNRPGEYTKFTANKGGGVKTLSAGNLNLPSSVVLWQNPQSVDTITILCVGSDGTSTCYYMTPADLNTQSSAVQVMGFEETTNTPGTTSPYGAIVHNNALFRPIDRALLKSTAQNYNINHKTLTDNIANMWSDLQFKNLIVGAVHDNRLYYLVNNPRGAALEDGCVGNEIWVYDMQGGEKGTWSRLLIQASSLRIIDYGSMVYMGLIRPDGLFYLDPNAREDDYVTADGKIAQRPIPWFFEMNTQGSNRARDSWAHVQQVIVKFGDFEGSVRYGIRGRTVHGKAIDISKVFEDYTVDKDDGLRWDIEDYLLIRRDLKEWYFSAGSVDGKPSSGAITFVQYRFTPTTVNVGYEYGSVETFEYGRDTAQGGSAYSQGGVPVPVQDRDWQRT